MGGEENRRHRLLTLPFAADIRYRRKTSGGTDHFDEHRSGGLPTRSFSSHGPLDGNVIVRSNNRVIFRETESLLIHRRREMDSNIGHAAEKLPSGAPCGFRARLHQLGEALHAPPV